MALLSLEEIFRKSYAVQSSETFSAVDLHEPINHALVVLGVLGVDVVVVLKAESGLNHPNWICHQQCKDASFTGGEHVQSWSEWLRRVAALDPSFDCVIAEKPKVS